MLGWKFALSVVAYALPLGLFKADIYTLIFGGIWYYLALEAFNKEYLWKDSKVQ